MNQLLLTSLMLMDASSHLIFLTVFSPLMDASYYPKLCYLCQIEVLLHACTIQIIILKLYNQFVLHFSTF